jgi:hypothetical protein
MAAASPTSTLHNHHHPLATTSTSNLQMMMMMLEHNDDTSSHGWLESGETASSAAVGCHPHFAVDTWNHPFMLEDDGSCNGDDCFFPVKRVSLDATETWMTDDESDDAAAATDVPFALDDLERDPVVGAFDTTSAHHHHSQKQLLLLQHDTFLVDDHLMEVIVPSISVSSSSDDGGTESARAACGSDGSNVDTSSLCRQFEERRQQLAARMRASKVSRQCLFMQQHLQQRKKLQEVLVDIERSTQAVQTHCLNSGRGTGDKGGDDDINDAVAGDDSADEYDDAMEVEETNPTSIPNEEAVAMTMTGTAHPDLTQNDNAQRQEQHQEDTNNTDGAGAPLTTPSGTTNNK